MKKIPVIVVIALFLGMAIAPSIDSQTVKKQDTNGGMRIDFCAEFASHFINKSDDIKKVELIDFSSTIYVAAYSLEEFRALKEKIYEINKNNTELEVGYVPLLEKSYFIHPFVYTYELENLIEELQNRNQSEKLKVLIDLEPFFYEVDLIEKFFSFGKNKRLIQYILENADEYNIEIFTAELSASNLFCSTKIGQKFLELIGVSYPLNKYPHKKIVMFYSSTFDVYLERYGINSSLIKMFYVNKIKSFIVHNSKKYGQRFQVALGCTATGITGKDPLLSPEDLDKDLNFLYKNGIKTAIIYRLGGLNESYLEVIKRYL